MKRILRPFTSLLALSLVLFLSVGSSNLLAQNKMSAETIQPQQVPHAEMAPGLQPGQSGAPSTNALWDVQFTHNVGQASGFGGLAGGVFHGNTFWVSQWNSDTLLSFDDKGVLIDTFTIPGLSGVRSMTSDGTSIYAGNASQTVYKIDPVNRTILSTISVPEAARHCTYDPTADGGNGGLWIGNWGTDIYQVSLSGATLATISSATHGLTSMYGSAHDNLTAGGPYLWVFYQGGVNSQAQIARLQLPAGTPTPIDHDVMSDIGSASTGGLAGGLFITDQLVTGENTLGGILQGTPDNLLFGYELDDANIPDVDAEITGLRPLRGYTQIPLKQFGAERFSATVSNLGALTADSIRFHARVQSGATTIYEDSVTQANIASATQVVLTCPTPFVATQEGNYDVTGWVTVPGPQTDPVTTNDIATVNMSVTDSTFARDDDVHNGSAGYLVSQTSSAYATVNYELVSPDTLTNVWIRINDPQDGDTTRAVVVSTSPLGFPVSVIYEGPDIRIKTGTNDYLLQIPGGLPLTAGIWSIGVYENAGNGIYLAQSNSIFSPDVNYFFTPGGGWSGSNIQTARFIRPNFGMVTQLVGIESGVLDGEVTLYPNPGSGDFLLNMDLAQPTDVTIEVTNALGQVIYQKSLNAVHNRAHGLDLNSQPNGIYYVRLTTDEARLVHKLVLSR